MISGFSFIHNALHAGYPIAEAINAVAAFVDEVVVVDMQSNDGTRELLARLGVRILDGWWEPGRDEYCLSRNYALHTECRGETILHFEADEVYEKRLVFRLIDLARRGQVSDLAVYRIQVEQNFQRVRWYPHLVHRVFPRGSTIKKGHTTNRASEAYPVDLSWGFLWDITNCFRDNWLDRVEQQAELWGDPNYLMVAGHVNHDVIRRRELAEAALRDPRWTWKTTPLAIPAELQPLVGKVRYEPTI
jgi:hypothetical protein